jgi:hypothetical protein
VNRYLAHVGNDLHGYLLAHQRDADKQASRWIEREIAGLMRGRVAFNGHKPRITWAKASSSGNLAHGAS